MIKYALAQDVSKYGKHLRKHCRHCHEVDADTIWTGTQAEYDNLTPDADTLYFITA